MCKRYTRVRTTTSYTLSESLLPAVIVTNRRHYHMPYIYRPVRSKSSISFHSASCEVKGGANFTKTGREGFIFEFFGGGGSLGYVNSILYFNFLFPSTFALNFCFQVRSTFVEFVGI